MGRFDFGSVGQLVWGAATRLFMPPGRRRGANKVKGGGISSRHLAALAEWQYPPLEGSATLVRSTASGSRKPRWPIW